MEQLISNGPEKVIFLDVDGVLNSNRSTEPTIAEDMVKRLAHIARKQGHLLFYLLPGATNMCGI